MSEKRQSVACNSCRRSKKKCNGESPCDRCKIQSKVCVYSPVKRRTIYKKLQKSTPLLSSEETLTNQTISRKFLETYYFHINPITVLNDFDVTNFDEISSKGLLLQYNCALATAARSQGGSCLYRSFEKRAIQLANELICDFHFDTALGFHMLAYHLWGEDENLSFHYRDIGRSLCHRVYSINKQKGEDVELILRLRLTLESITPLLGVPTPQNMDILEKLTQNSHFKNSNNDLVELATLRPRVFSVLLKDIEDPTYDSNPFKIISPEEHKILCVKVSRFDYVMAQCFSGAPDFVTILSIYLNFMKVLLFYTGGSGTVAIHYAHVGLNILEENPQLVQFCCPILITLSHLVFMVAYLEKNTPLAHRVSLYQQKFVEKLPIGRELLDKDLKKLESLGEFQHDELKYGSLCGDIPSPLISDIKCCELRNTKNIMAILPPDLMNNSIYDEIEKLVSTPSNTAPVPHSFPQQQSLTSRDSIASPL